MRAFARLPDPVRRRHQLVLVCRLDPLERNHYDVLGRGLGLTDGELLLTGLVSDTTLVHLYRERGPGGLPVLLRGVRAPGGRGHGLWGPVVASDTSSLRELVAPESTFDPSDPMPWPVRWSGAWSTRGPPAAAPVVGPTAQPTWTPTWPARRRSTGAWDRTRWPRAPSTGGVAPAALCGPGHPVASGHHRRGLVSARVGPRPRRLGRGRRVPRRQRRGGIPSGHGVDSYPAPALPLADSVRGGYEEVIAYIGNSQHHAGALALVRRRRVPATVLAHDVRLNGLYRHGAARGAVPEGIAAVLTGLYEGASDRG